MERSLKLSAKEISICALFSTLMIVSSHIKIPVGFVPITMSSFTCIITGYFLGSRLGFLTLFIYMLLGLIGLPIFSGGGGIGYVLSPSFGFVIGYMLSSYIAGKLFENAKEKSFTKVFLYFAIAGFSLYLIGLPYMALILKFYLKKEISIYKILKTGFLIFVPGDLLKIFLATKVAQKFDNKNFQH